MNIKTSIKDIVENSDSPSGRAFDLFIQCLIIISLVSFSIETLPDLSATAKNSLAIIETITVVIFTAEYLTRLFVADNKLRFVFSFYGLIDLMAILPFYLARGVDLRSLRIFRLFRLMRALKIFRYNRAVDRFRKAFTVVRDELILFLITAGFLLFISSVGIYYFENPKQPEVFSSVFASLWWAVATLTTVGYGDIYPVTVGGKIFTSVMLVIGLGIVAIPAGLIASALTKTLEDEDNDSSQCMEP